MYFDAAWAAPSQLLLVENRAPTVKGSCERCDRQVQAPAPQKTRLFPPFLPFRPGPTSAKPLEATAASFRSGCFLDNIFLPLFLAIPSKRAFQNTPAAGITTTNDALHLIPSFSPCPTTRAAYPSKAPQARFPRGRCLRSLVNRFLRWRRRQTTFIFRPWGASSRARRPCC